MTTFSEICPSLSPQIPDTSTQKIPNLVLIQSWSEVIENLRNLRELSIRFQVMRGHLKRMLTGSVEREHKVLMKRQVEEARYLKLQLTFWGKYDKQYRFSFLRSLRPPSEKPQEREELNLKMISTLAPYRLRSLCLEGCVLDKRDLKFLEDFLSIQSETLRELNLGLMNYRQLCLDVLPLLQRVPQVRSYQANNWKCIFVFDLPTLFLQLTCFSVHMSGRVEHRERRRVPPIHVRDLVRILL